LAKFFEDFNVGDMYTTRKRVVTGTDVDLFATLTGAVNPLFLSDEFAQHLGFGKRLVPGILTLALSVGLEYQQGLFDNLLALLGINNVRFLNVVLPGDILKTQVEVLSKKEARKPDRGVVTLKSTCKNQKEDSVLEMELVILIKKK